MVLTRPRAGTIPLFRWYDPDRGDNWTTTQHGEIGARREGLSPNYHFSRLEGYVFDPGRPPPEGSRPLDRSWSEAVPEHREGRFDNFTTTHPTWIGPVGKTNTPGYAIQSREGYVLDPGLFSHCRFEVATTDGLLPDFAVLDILRNARRMLLVSVINEGWPGRVTQVGCTSPRQSAANNERIELGQGERRLVRVIIFPEFGQEAHCFVVGEALDGTPEPIGENNSLRKAPRF